MRKFILPIINLVNVVLVSIVFGLGSNTAITSNEVWPNRGNWYSLVWEGTSKGANVLGIVGFFLFVFAVAGIVAAFIPLGFRKYVNAATGAMLIAAGVLFLLTPEASERMAYGNPEITGSLIAMAVLVFVAGALAIGMSVIEFLPTKEDK